MSFFLVSNDTDNEIVEGIENTKMILDKPVAGVWTNRSCGYDTREALLECEGVQSEPCSICGNLYGTHYIEPTKTKLIESGHCFGCNFWTEYVSDKRKIIIAGSQFINGGESTDSNSWLGHGGRRFNIERKDGRQISTNNLWSQGKIPQHIKDYYDGDFDDNAVFI
jgi:hypothetical protein